MKIVNTLLPVSLVCFLVLFPVAWSYCFQSSSCFDSDTNRMREKDETWLTKSCERCSCTSNTVPVKTCIELLPSTDADTSEGENGDWVSVEADYFQPTHSNNRRSIPEIILPADEAANFECPQFPNNFLNQDSAEFIFPHSRMVHYVSVEYTADCCATFVRPTQVDKACKAIWVPEECRYDVVEKISGNPCNVTSSSFVGK